MSNITITLAPPPEIKITFNDAGVAADRANVSAAAAATSEDNAETWAEGLDAAVVLLGGEKSSKGWAIQAQAVYDNDIEPNMVNIDIVATNIADVQTVSTNIADVQFVAGATLEEVEPTTTTKVEEVLFGTTAGTVAEGSNLSKALTSTATASAALAGVLRYREEASASYLECCMETAADTYSWVVIKENTWS